MVFELRRQVLHFLLFNFYSDIYRESAMCVNNIRTNPSLVSSPVSLIIKTGWNIFSKALLMVAFLSSYYSGF